MQNEEKLYLRYTFEIQGGASFPRRIEVDSRQEADKVRQIHIARENPHTMFKNFKLVQGEDNKLIHAYPNHRPKLVIDDGKQKGKGIS